MRAALLALSLLALQPSVPLATEPTPFLIDNNIIPKVECGEWMGTGVYVGNGEVATAKHVVSGPGSCTVDGKAAKVVGGVPNHDFALLRVNVPDTLRAIINCSGFVEGHHYLAVGFAMDAPRTVEQRLVGSFAASSDPGFVGLIIFRGAVTQGMSGGPIFDEDDGTLVGIINANMDMGVTEVLGFPMSATPLCEGRTA